MPFISARARDTTQNKAKYLITENIEIEMKNLNELILLKMTQQ